MRISSRLVQVAALLAAGVGGACGGATAGGPQTGDAGEDGIATGSSSGGSSSGGSSSGGCSLCGCTKVIVSSAQACAMEEQSQSSLAAPVQTSESVTCRLACNTGYAYECQLPDSYVAQIEALNPNGGATDGGPRVLQCPASPTSVVITCLAGCLGRLTAGYAAPQRDDTQSEGERFAAMSYLEAVSVHAFERLERELRAHGAPPALLREARRARRDEVRHTAMTARLATTRGARARVPEAPAPATARSLFAVALENAVEGCVRETYGAVMGLVGAQKARGAPLGRVMQSIADDECRHAELAWAVYAWAAPRLSADERRRVQDAMREAVAEIASRDPHGARLLFVSGPTALPGWGGKESARS